MQYCFYDILEVSNILERFNVSTIRLGEINPKAETINELMAQGMNVAPSGLCDQFGEPVCLIRDDYIDKILDVAGIRKLTCAINSLTPVLV